MYQQKKHTRCAKRAPKNQKTKEKPKDNQIEKGQLKLAQRHQENGTIENKSNFESTINQKKEIGRKLEERVC